MIHLLPDDFFGNERLDEIRRTCGEPDLVAMNTTLLDGQRLGLDELVAAAGALPFLAERRLVVVRRLLAQGEAKPAEGATERKRTGRADRARAIADWLPQLPETTELVLLEPAGSLKATNPIYQAVSRLGGEILAPRQLDPDQLADWIVHRVRSRGGRIEPRAAALLASFAPTVEGSNGKIHDLQRLSQEVDKLLTYAADAEVSAADVRLLVGESREENIFALVDAIGRRERGRALALLREVLGKGEPAPRVLVMIVRQVRLLLQVRELLTTTSDQGQVASALRLPPWLARNLIGQARRFSLADLERAYRQLLDTDRAIKTSSLDQEIALDLLVADLTGP